jgi:flagellar hook-associated protein 1 FlgK
MTDLLNVGARSLVNIQQLLGTTGHNIANVNTEGYSRQTVNVAALWLWLCGAGRNDRRY